MNGAVAEEHRVFTVSIGVAAHAKQKFRVGDEVTGKAMTVADSRTETAEFYKASGIRVISRGPDTFPPGPPFVGVPPTLAVYRERGHQRLAHKTYEEKCTACIWACAMPVEMIIDQWDPGRKRYRVETHCYGPLSCARYRSGPPIKVPGRKGMVWVEEDWVDEEATRHRKPDE